jgi:PIN domain nuclease of toxin-antitoxin system
MRVLLDTQALLTLALDGLDGVPGKVRGLLQKSDTECALSAISITEIAIKNSIGKLEASSEAVSEMIADLQITVLPFSGRHAHRLFGLPLHHREPFDRMIIAVALTDGLPLVGRDSRFPLYSAQGLIVIWN